MTDAKPYTKEAQLARGPKRYRRKVASPKQWQAIQSAKVGPCRVCCDPGRNGGAFGRIQLHHVVPRDAPYFGDDVADNIVPLCPLCHDRVTRRVWLESQELCETLTDAEYAYAVGKAGEGFAERIYGIEYER